MGYGGRAVIVYLRRKRDYLDRYVKEWAPALAPRLRTFSYDELREWPKLPSATYVFTEIWHLNAQGRARAIELWRRLASADTTTRLLNDPSLVPGRYELLRRLHDLGVNTHRAYWLYEAHRARFPVFLRSERNHSGALTRLLWSRPELMGAVVWAYRRGVPMRDLIVVEFCDVADADGNYNKYGAYFVDGRVVPRGLTFRPEWMVKPSAAPMLEPRYLELHRQYVETNPHESWVRMVFSAAQIDYGRIDYSLQDGCPRAWEINTNPAPLGPGPVPPVLRPHVQLFAEALQEAFEAIDIGGDASALGIGVAETG